MVARTDPCRALAIMLPFSAVFALAGLVIAIVWAIRTTRDKRRSMPARAHAPSRRPWLLAAGASCTLASFSFAVAAIACSQLVRCCSAAAVLTVAGVRDCSRRHQRDRAAHDRSACVDASLRDC